MFKQIIVLKLVKKNEGFINQVVIREYIAHM